MRLGRRQALGAITLAVVAAGAAGVGIAEAGSPPSGSTPSKGADRYGGLPSYLSTSSLRSDSIVTGSAEHPALTSEGDPVRVELPRGTVTATVSGPVVPGEGLPFQADATTATWTVTLSGASRAIPIRLRDFSTIDSLGKTYRLAFVPGQPTAPKSLRAGRSTTFELRAAMRVGEGMLRWAPVNDDLVATWDFVVEND